MIVSLSFTFTPSVIHDFIYTCIYSPITYSCSVIFVTKYELCGYRHSKKAHGNPVDLDKARISTLRLLIDKQSGLPKK